MMYCVICLTRSSNKATATSARGTGGESVQTRRTLGSGGSCVVEAVQLHGGTQTLAVKLIRRGLEDNAKTAAEELKILRRVQHRHIVKLVCSFTAKISYDLVMTLVAKYDLA